MNEKLAHASGALADIYILTTSCVAVDASKEAHELAEAITRRILCSAHKVHHAPSWFRHEWERQLWQELEKGQICTCGIDELLRNISLEEDTHGTIFANTSWSSHGSIHCNLCASRCRRSIE